MTLIVYHDVAGAARQNWGENIPVAGPNIAMILFG
jgi:hypothetical protein